MEFQQRIMRICLAIVALTPIAAGRASAELADLYPRDALQQDATRLETAARKIYSLGIEPSLSSEEKAGIGDVTFRFPMPKPADDPFDFYAFRDKAGRSVVVMPVLSLKAVEDMMTAYAWVQIKGLRLSTVDLYYAMLRHRSESKFPDGRYVGILPALGIPVDANTDPAVDRLSLSLRNEAYAFILTHELGHVLFRHKGYRDITKAQARADELQSDRFALDILARSATPPLGAVLFFQAQVYRFRHRGEFATNPAWDDYLMTVATHPMSVDRITAMAEHIAGPLADARGNEKAIWQGIGLQLGEVANILRDTDLQRCIARIAALAPFEVLKPGKDDPTWAFETVCSAR